MPIVDIVHCHTIDATLAASAAAGFSFGLFGIGNDILTRCRRAKRVSGTKKRAFFVVGSGVGRGRNYIPIVMALPTLLSIVGDLQSNPIRVREKYGNIVRRILRI